MSTLAQRSTALQLIDEACKAGARRHLACAVIGAGRTHRAALVGGWQKRAARRGQAHP